MENNMFDVCNICNSKGTVSKINNKEIYGKSYGNGMAYRCSECKSYVGCHDSGKPLGILSDSSMRKLKVECHELFDVIWKKRAISRGNLYGVLANKLNIKKDDCHFGHFDINRLNEAISIMKVKDWWRNEQ